MEINVYEHHSDGSFYNRSRMSAVSMHVDSHK